MSIQQKIIQYQGLTDYETHIVDTLPTSKYFKVFSLEDTIPGGRSTFQILGSEFLENGVELKIELLDVNGIPVYTEPIKYLGDDPSRHIMIEVYPATAIGVGRLTILGSVIDVPDEWKGLYNVKWEKDVFIDQVSKNTQPILFRGQGIDLVRNQRYPLPEIEISETVTGVVVASGSGGNEFVTSSIFEGGSYDGNASPFARPMHIGDLINARTQESLIDSPPRNMGHAGIGGGQTAKTSYAAKPKNQQNTSDTTAIETNVVEQKYEEFHKPQAEPTPPPTPPIPQVASKPISTPPPVETKAKQPDAVGKGTLIKRKSGEPFRLELAGGTFKSTPVVSDLVEGIKGREFESSSFTASIVAVHSPDLIEIDTPFVVEDKTPEKDDDPFIPVPHTGSDYTIDFEPVSTGSASEVILQSFANITIKNMKTFSGDVHRVKVFAKGFSTQGDFRLVSDKIVEGTDVLINTGSVSLTQKTGKFIDQQHIDNNWQVKHIKRGTNTVGVVDTQGTATFTSSVHPPLMNAVLVSGSNTLADESILFETTTPKIKLRPNVDYTLYVNAVLKTAGTDVLQDDGSILNNQPKAKVRFYVSGSNLGQDLKGIKPASSGSIGNILGDPIKVITAEDEPQGEVIELKTKGSEIGKTIDFGRVKIPFKPQFTGDGLTTNDDTKLQIEVEEGELFIQSVGIEPSSDTNFNPDEFTFQVPMPKLRKRPDFFDFLVEFYDRDGNKAGYTTIKEAVEFDGENDVIQGTDNLLTGSLSIGNALGVGIEAAGVNSAYIRSVDYAGFDSSSVSGRGGFLMFSGSVSRSLNTSESYDGVGLELHDGNSGSFKFRTQNADGVGEFDVRTNKFFFGKEGVQFVSGSDDKIEISSSNFHLEGDGTLTIGADANILGGLTATSIQVPNSSNPLAEIKSTGAASFTSASIGGFNVSEGAISSSNGELVLKANGQITGSNFKLDGGTIASGVTIDAAVAANSLSLPAVGTKTAVITAQGEATFSKAEIGSFKIGNQEIRSLSGSLILSASGAITASDILATGNITANAGQVFQDVTNLHATSGALETDISSSISRSIGIETITGSLIISQSDIRVSLTSSKTESDLVAKGFGEKAVVSASNFAQGAEATASALAIGAESSASLQVTESLEFTREQTGSLKDFSTGAAESGSEFAKEFAGGAIASASLLGEGAVASASELGAGAILSSSVVLANVTKSFGDSTGSFNTRFNFVGTQTASLILRADDIERTTGSLNAETSSIRTVFDGVGQNTASILLATESLFLSSSEAKSSASFAASGSQVFSKFSSSLVLASASAEFVSSASILIDNLSGVESSASFLAGGAFKSSSVGANASHSLVIAEASQSVKELGTLQTETTASRISLASSIVQLTSSFSESRAIQTSASAEFKTSASILLTNLAGVETSASFLASGAFASASTDATSSILVLNTLTSASISTSASLVSASAVIKAQNITDEGIAPIRTDVTQSRFEVGTLQTQATQSIGELTSLQTETTASRTSLASSIVQLTSSFNVTAQVSHSFGLATASIKTQATSSDVEITASRATFSGSLALDEVTFVSGGAVGGRSAAISASSRRSLKDIFDMRPGANKLSLRNDLTISSEQSSGNTTSFSSYIETCVLPGTKILIKREDILAQINIEDTKKDDLIYVFDFKTKEFDWSPIKKITNRMTKEGWSHIKTEKGYELKCSNSHLLYHPDYPNNAIATNELGIGGQLYVFENNKIVEDKINFIQVYDELVEVWNYELEFTHNYISNGILSHNAVPKPFTAGHRYFSSENLQKGDLVRLNQNSEIVKTTEQKDSSVLGIVWYEFCLDSFSVDGEAAEKSDENIFRRDSMGRIYSDEQLETKKLWKIASIGDTRFNYYTKPKQKLNGLKICNQNGEVKKGDLLCSSDTPGYAMKQPTEFVITSITYNGSENNYEERQNMNSFTIGKSMEDVEFDENGKSEGVYGYLYCG